MRKTICIIIYVSVASTARLQRKKTPSDDHFRAFNNQLYAYVFRKNVKIITYLGILKAL